MAISEKYVAGLIDSDGSICWTNVTQDKRPTLVLRISQLQYRSDVLNRLKEQYGGIIHLDTRSKNVCCDWQLHGKKAVMLISRLVKYLVIKKDYAKWALLKQTEILKTSTIEFNAERKHMRKLRISSSPNFPTRKWLAGYFDGDGCVQVETVRQDNTGYIRFTVVAHNDDRVGLDIIHKNFGGSITSNGPSISVWALGLNKGNPNQVEKFLDYFFKHSIIKYDQLLAVKQYLNSEIKDAQRLKEKLKLLKQPPAETNSINVLNISDSPEG